MEKFILAIDQGTTSCRALIIDHQGQIIGTAQREFTQIFPKPGWVEHDPLEILDTQLAMIHQVIDQSNINPNQIAAIGITNQRETTVLWDRETGQPVYNALVWQDKRTAPICEELKSQGLAGKINEKTGLVVDSYFSATKAKWVLEHSDDARKLAAQGRLCFGTIDTWLIWNLTNGNAFVTDYTNASRTMLYNIHELKWDTELCELLNIPLSILPEVQASSNIFGYWDVDGIRIPIAGVAGDQQAALFGQQCLEPGSAKNTYGTGCFMLMNTGETAATSANGLLTTIAWGLDGKVTYALEGSVFVAGAAIQWLRDGINIIGSAQESESLAMESRQDHGVVVVPAFVGLGAPYWDMYARGAIFGLTRDTGKPELVQATLQSLAYQTRDILEAMQQDSGIKLQRLKVDGGATANAYLMQFQADVLDVEVERPLITETTAMGAAFLSGLATEYWEKDDLGKLRNIDRIFIPEMDADQREKYYSNWKKAIDRTKGWLKD